MKTTFYINTYESRLVDAIQEILIRTVQFKNNITNVCLICDNQLIKFIQTIYINNSYFTTPQ